jgi:peptidoglycan hydrolase-like protein with peptidoglycan-binding domain
MVRAIDSHRATTTEIKSLRDVQQALTDLGFSPGAIDGVDGRNTRNAVRAFQMSKGLGADGIAGPATKAALENALKSA